MSSKKYNIDRRPVYTTENKIEDIVPSYMLEEYPRLIELLKAYYEFENSEYSPSNNHDSIKHARDITDTSEELLEFLEDELLLGKSYFGGFQNKRSAAKFSNNLYRSKGTLYSIQQFFKMFFNEPVEVVYTKESRFIVGESNIGFDDQKFITDNKLYQSYAILLKTGISVDVWREVYKTFVHPAGMYFAGQVQVETVGSLKSILNANMPDHIPADFNLSFESIATTNITAYGSYSAYVADTDAQVYRTDIPTSVEMYSAYTVGEAEEFVWTIEDLISPSSPTMDDDIKRTMDEDADVIDTFDEVYWPYYDPNAV